MELRIEGLSKYYGEKKALNQVSLVLQEGIYGILGANGAGKSTLMNLLTDNLKRDYGKISLDGVEILTMGSQYRSLLGYMPQQQGFYEHFSAKAFLMYMARLKGLKTKDARKQIDELLKILNLGQVSSQKIGGFSGGMKQRVLLAQALLGNPKILILDEPTAGLDPKERIHIRNLISELSEDKIILLATHVVSDIECIADQVLLMKQGNLIGQGTPKELIANLQGKVAQTICTKKEMKSLQEKYQIGNITQGKDGLMFRLVGEHFDKRFDVIEDNIGLEDVYLYYFEYQSRKELL